MASKYHSKQGKGKSVKAVVAHSELAPVFLYNSDCCGELAKKTACVIDNGAKFEDRKSSLGHWRCSACRRSCKVTRKLNKDGVIPFRPKHLSQDAVTGSTDAMVADLLLFSIAENIVGQADVAPV